MPSSTSDGLLWLHLREDPLPDPPKTEEPEKPAGVRFKPREEGIESDSSPGAQAGRALRRTLVDELTVAQMPQALAQMLRGCGAHVEISLIADPFSESWRFTARVYVSRDQEFECEVRISRLDVMYPPGLRDVLQDMSNRIREAIRENTRIDIRP